MPIYEYACRKCGKAFELRRSVAQLDAPAPCPHCKSRRTERRLSAFAVARGATPSSAESGEEDRSYANPDGGGDDWGDDDDW